jgi:casein kinase I family protein HRR25
MPIQADHHILTGTASFASLNSHLGIEQSCCDDLESLAYILIYFLRGSLPWYNAKASTHNQRNKIKQMKVNSIPSLVAGLPNEFSIFLDYTCAFGFESKPDYAYMRRLFRDLRIREEREDDDIFDWCLPMMNRDDETLSNHTRVDGKTREYDTGAVGYSDRVLVLFYNLRYIYV